EAKTEEAKAEEPKEPEVPKKNYDEERQKLIKQGLQFLATHEVGHTLGLRHNFKLSSLYSLDELNDPVKTAEYGYAGSIMEYLPVNIMPKGMPQGDYSPTKLGQYDYWVIEYGYKPFGKGTDGELEDLKKIAEQQTRPELNYATDEDCYGMSADPLVNVFDLGKSPLEYAKLRARLVKEILPGLNDRIIKEGESYSKMRARFAALLSWHGSGMTFAARYIGGIHVNRDFKGDPNSRPPFEVVAAQDQRDALAFLNEEVFGVDSYNIPANIYNYLAPNRWRHWGSKVSSRYDLDIHGSVLSWQTAILGRLFSSATLSRLADSQLRVGPDQDVFTSAELVESLTTAIFKELESLKEGKFSIQNQAIRSVRRNLQRIYYEMLADAALNSTSSTAGEADFYALARLQLSRIRTNIQAVLSGNAELDPYTKAHLSELETRITQTLDASITRSL
ncbi:MAG: zinc-dependent metalloprotease, partial [Planctomycetia bacterium]|nr:zinc-dependent metalloprotease [Planctomycetia bacterium]